MKPTVDQFSQMIPSNRSANEWYSVAVSLFDKYEINTMNRIAGFMAQAGHESMDFKITEENLNYSADRLLEVFSSFFQNSAHAQQFHRNPQKIANYVYDDRHPARRNKIGNVFDGDGWKFRGAGIIQLTGRTNFTRFADYMKMSLDDVLQYIRTREGSLESALWFWSSNNLNRFADSDDIVTLSRRVNGGDNGLQDRINRYNRNKQILEETIELKRGSRGNLVKEIQQKLGLNADGIFGPNTESAVRNWQNINRYVSNGILTQQQINQIRRG